MTGGDNAEEKRSSHAVEVEGEQCFRTVEFLRGRLLAERMASRNAKEEAEQVENKLIELEIKLKEETKSRNRAEKKLNFLMKKLESLNITWVSDESEQSSFLEKSEISSVSSSTLEAEGTGFNSGLIKSVICEDSIENSKSALVPVPQNLQQNVSQTRTSSHCQDSPAAGENFGSGSNANSPELEAQKKETEESREMTNSPTLSNRFKQNASRNSAIINHGCPCPATPDEEIWSSSVEAHSLKSIELESSQKDINSDIDDHIHSLNSSIKEEILGGDGVEELYDHVDNSFALVPVNLPKTKQTSDPSVIDATVKEVLDALKHAKEKLETSMERRRMIKVG